MEENVSEGQKKRKDRNTPPSSEKRREGQSHKKVKEDFPILSSEEDEYRSRTPSGTICEFNPKDIRTFFLREEGFCKK